MHGISLIGLVRNNQYCQVLSHSMETVNNQPLCEVNSLAYVHACVKYILCQIRIYSDCEGAIKTIQKQYSISFKHVFVDDADVLYELRFLYKKLKIIIDLQHVRSHQNKKLKFKNLSAAAQINHLNHDLAYNYFESNFEKTKCH